MSTTKHSRDDNRLTVVPKSRGHRVDLTEIDLRQITYKIWTILLEVNALTPFLLQRGGELVSMQWDAHDNVTIAGVTTDLLKYILTELIEFYVTWEDQNGKVHECPKPVPAYIVRNVLAKPDKDLPPLRGVTRTPYFDRNGKLIETPGYCQETGIIFAPPLRRSRPAEVSDSPDRDEIEFALETLRDLFCGFPFVGAASWAYTLAALLVLFARDLIDGPTPLHLIEKPKGGTGASLLAQVIAYIAVGQFYSGLTLSHSDDEFSRKLVASLLGGPSIVTIDNVDEYLRSASLSSIVTAGVYTDRLVRTSRETSVRPRCLWVITANNPSLSSDLERRTVRIRLDARVEQPELRQKFKHENLLAYVRKKRHMVIWACLTLIQAWVVAGRPKGSPRLGMFGSYSETIGGILQVAGVEGFLSDVKLRHESDPVVLSRRAFTKAWFDTYGTSTVKARDLTQIARDTLDIDGTDQSLVTQIGLLLEKLRDQRLGELFIRRAAAKTGNSRSWRLEHFDRITLEGRISAAEGE